MEINPFVVFPQEGLAVDVQMLLKLRKGGNRS